jgi:voltage-gated potassium channel
MKKTLLSIIALVAILTFGSLGYMILEDASFDDGLYMTMITVTTVGYGEMVHLSPAGRHFTMVLILIGVGYVMVVFREITESVVEGGIRSALGKRNMSKKLEKMRDHYVVCGFGRIGQVICQLLKENNKKFVIIEKSDEEIEQILELGYMALKGDASDDDMLIQAGVARAKGLVGVVSSDADNVYISLSARSLNPELYIVARSSGDRRAEEKLKRAGADQVISPYYIGAFRMASLILRPTVTDFIDLAVSGSDLGLRLEEIVVTANATTLVNKTLMESEIRKNFNIIVVVIKRKAGHSVFNPTPITLIEEGDTLVVLGEVEQIKALEKTMSGS